jgi:hypothetical protein
VAKVRVDGAIAHTLRNGSAAAICRDSNGKYLGASALMIPGIEDPTTAEALSCREALALASDLNISKVLITNLT